MVPNQSALAGALVLFVFMQPGFAVDGSGVPQSTERKDSSSASTALPLPIPATPEETTAQWPTVTFSNGMLTVSADNSTLRDVLVAIQAKTGIVIEMPPEIGDRVAIQAGPGDVRKILLEVLEGAKLNCVIVSSVFKPEEIERLILTPRSEFESEILPRRNVPMIATLPVPPPTAADDGAETAANTVEEEEKDPEH